jgi:hypothetical protein
MRSRHNSVQWLAVNWQLWRVRRDNSRKWFVSNQITGRASRQGKQFFLLTSLIIDHPPEFPRGLHFGLMRTERDADIPTAPSTEVRNVLLSRPTNGTYWMYCYQGLPMVPAECTVIKAYQWYLPMVPTECTVIKAYQWYLLNVLLSRPTNGTYWMYCYPGLPMVPT